MTHPFAARLRAQGLSQPQEQLCKLQPSGGSARAAFLAGLSLGLVSTVVVASLGSSAVYRDNPAPEGPSVRKEDYLVHEITPDASIRAFVTSHHYSRTVSNTWSHVFGMFDKATGELVGVAWWMPSMPQAHDSALDFVEKTTGLRGDRSMVLHLSRLVVAPGLLKNAAGLLLSSSMRILSRRKYPILLTYADSSVVDARTGEAHKGTVYKATNWIDAGMSPGGRVWVHKETGEQRGQKRGKVNIPSAQMRAMGYVQKVAIPKHRYLHIDKRSLRWALEHKGSS